MNEIFNYLPINIFTKDEAGKFIYINKHAEESIGIKLNEAKNKTMSDSINQKNIISSLQKIANTKAPYKFVQFFPELSYLRIIFKNNENQVYSIIRNKAHYNSN